MVRIAVLQGAYRKVRLERLVEEPTALHGDPSEALKACLEKAGPVDIVCSTLPGNETFVHRLSIPTKASKRMSEVLPFELEAELPLEIGEVVFDHSIVGGAVDGAIPVLTLAARKASLVREIERIRTATGFEPERVGASHLELAQLSRLSAALAQEERVCLLYLGLAATDVCWLEKGQTRFGRTISIGVGAFPDAAERLAAQIRQTLSGFGAKQGTLPTKLVLCGEGALLPGMNEFLSSRLEVTVETLPVLDLDGLDELDQGRIPAFARALATAAHGLRRSGFDLRQGELAFERGYGFIKERAPLLGALVALLVLSFLFSTWAQGRALESENASLVATLEALTQQTFEKSIGDPELAQSEVDTLRKVKPEDPMPYLDGFGVAVALAETLPEGIVHDVESLEYSKGKLVLRGIVGSTDEAQRVAKAFDGHPCIDSSNVSKISQVVNSDRARYVLDAKVACSEDQVEADKSAKKAGGGK